MLRLIYDLKIDPMPNIYMFLRFAQTLNEFELTNLNTQTITKSQNHIYFHEYTAIQFLPQ